MNDERAGIPADFLINCGVDPATVARPAAMETLCADLAAANEKANLTRITGRDAFWVLHVADSLAAGLFFPELTGGACAAVDVGCGAGFPLLPLAWANPRLAITGLERRKKKVDFVAAMIAKLGLTNAAVVRRQAREHAGQYDYVLLRAAGKPAKMVRAVRRLLAPGGRIVFYATPTAAAADLPLARREAEKFGLAAAVTDPFTLPGGAPRCFLTLEKPARPGTITGGA